MSGVLPRPAQYLLRLDDLCPTMERERWQRYFALIESLHVRPILAVVPDNQDPDLKRSAPDAGFWRQMRAMESAGATIALHGYRHLARGEGRSLLPLHRRSEFAGVSAERQRAWIAEGLRILRGQGLDPKIWIAPQHGFDGSTLRALGAEGIQFLSDGFARTPLVRGGITWIPQQLWGPVEKREGLWTICVHPNTAGDAEFAELEVFLRGHAEQFTSVERVVKEIKAGRLGMGERIYEKLALWRVRASHARGQRRILGNS